MSNKVRVLITGANSGIGFYTASELLKNGADLILACRNYEKAKKARQDLLSLGCSGEVDIVPLDLNCLSSIKNSAEFIAAKYEYINVLINNAGIFGDKLFFTEDGYEQQFGVNYLGPFLLTHLLLPLLKKSNSGRIIHLSSVMHLLGKIDYKTFGKDLEKYSSIKAYGQSKLANILFSNSLSRKLEGTNITSNSLHPGAVNSEIYRDLPKLQYLCLRPFLISPSRPAKLISSMALDVSWKNCNGKYVSAHLPNWQSNKSKSEELADEFYNYSLNLVKDFL